MVPLHEDCPLGDGGYTAIMIKLEHLETLMLETQRANERRLLRLENVTGKQLFIGGLISAVVAGVILAFRFAVGGGGE